jgi:hypothetical protein
MIRNAILVLAMLAGAFSSPAFADPRETDFVSIHQCENYLNRWRNSLERPTSGHLAYLKPLYYGAYCEQSPNGRFNVVWPS